MSSEKKNPACNHFISTIHFALAKFNWLLITALDSKSLCGNLTRPADHSDARVTQLKIYKNKYVMRYAFRN